MSVTNPEHILSLRGQDYVSLVEQAQKNPQLIKDVEELEHQAIQMYKGTTEVILPGQNYQWVFQIDTNKIDEINKRPIYLRYKFNAGDEYDPKSHLCTWTVGAGTGKHWPANEQPKQIKVGSSVFHELWGAQDTLARRAARNAVQLDGVAAEADVGWSYIVVAHDGEDAYDLPEA